MMADGTKIPENVVKRCDEIVEEESIQFEWEKGDVLFFDNFALLHGRRPALPPSLLEESLLPHASSLISGSIYQSIMSPFTFKRRVVLLDYVLLLVLILRIKHAFIKSLFFCSLLLLQIQAPQRESQNNTYRVHFTSDFTQQILSRQLEKRKNLRLNKCFLHCKQNVYFITSNKGQLDKGSRLRQI